jgi:hypothetical protein
LKVNGLGLSKMVSQLIHSQNMSEITSKTTMKVGLDVHFLLNNTIEVGA